MGYYFEKAKTSKELSPEQLTLYTRLRSPDQIYPQVLLDRLAAIKEYIGPVTSGEVWSAYEELAEDAFVTWILADEDSSSVEWSNPQDLVVPEPKATEEEKAERTRLYNEKYAYELSLEGRQDRQRRMIKAYGYRFADEPEILPLWERLKLYIGWY